ncbi:MAG: hydroxymethylglutaryl-CoA reductase, degradative [Gemella sp.]|nr:hydroxymethylglutaryl-CoA reductase, degradative [Gemella sp.]
MTFSGFYKKTREERVHILREAGLLSPASSEILLKNDLLDTDIAGQMAENHLGLFALPYSIIPQIKVDNKIYSVPMVTEEPSVVAAASNVSKLVMASGGFTSHIAKREMIGHVALYDVADVELATKNIDSKKDYLLQVANDAHPSIVKRGGGARDIFWEIKEESGVTFLVVYLSVDVQEAMGANMLNNMLEALKPVLEELTSGTALMAILSNYATNSLVSSTCQIDVATLDKDLEQAREIAKKIELASIFAKVDVYRAATHNKGIFNGIDSIVIASGNDWRAIEASGHSYAARDGKYKGLTTWTYDKEKDILHGQLTLPMPVATVGGSIGLNDTVKITHEILGTPTAKELAAIIVSVGLAQNLAALKALVGKGIQAGHMKLHAKSLALLAGAKPEQVEIVAEKLRQAKHMNLETAEKIIREL